MPVLRILVVDDDPQKALRYAALLLRREDEINPVIQTEVAVATSTNEALSRLVRARGDGLPFDVLVTDLFMPGESGLALISQLRDNDFEPAELDVILVSQGDAETRTAEIERVTAAWTGPDRPPLPRLLRASDQHESEFLNAVFDTVWRRLDAFRRPALTEFSPSPHAVRRGRFQTNHGPLQTQINKALDVWAPTTVPIVIYGETGTGKEILARDLHDQSGRTGAFIPVNVQEIPSELWTNELYGHEPGAYTGANTRTRGLVQAADGGTLFIDELHHLPMDTQLALLRPLQSKTIRRRGSTQETPVNFRLIAATNVDLEKAVQANRFHPDLFHRIQGFQINLPALAERREDIPMLARYFWRNNLDELPARSEEWDEEAFRPLYAWAWPGNVRELQRFITALKLEVPRSERVRREYVETAMGRKPPYVPGLSDHRKFLGRMYHVIFYTAANATVPTAANKTAATAALVEAVLERYPIEFADHDHLARKRIREAWGDHWVACVECKRIWLRWS